MFCICIIQYCMAHVTRKCVGRPDGVYSEKASERAQVAHSAFHMNVNYNVREMAVATSLCKHCPSLQNTVCTVLLSYAHSLASESKLKLKPKQKTNSSSHWPHKTHICMITVQRDRTYRVLRRSGGASSSRDRAAAECVRRASRASPRRALPAKQRIARALSGSG